MSERYEMLKKIIDEAMHDLRTCDAVSLMMLLTTAAQIRSDAIRFNEESLIEEAERLMRACETEIEKRGGEKFLESVESDLYSGAVKGLKKLTDSEIITRVMEAKAMSLWGGSKEATKLEKYITAARAELASRGVEIKLEAQEVFKSQKKEVNRTPVVVPSPSDIINGKSVEGLPNT